jgi:quinol monooxygenase YgiN
MDTNGAHMIIVEGFVQLAPKELDRLRPVAVEMIRETRKEAGCLDYAFAADLADPGTVRIIERWESEDALARHFATPHMAKFNAALSKAKIVKASAKVYRAELVRTLMGD